MFQELAWNFQLIICFWCSTKCDLEEVEKATMLVVARHCEHIFCVLTSANFYLDEVEKSNILIVECHFDVIFCFLTNRKHDFFKAIKVVERHLKVTFCLLPSPEFDFVVVEKEIFQVVSRIWKLFLPLNHPKIRLW